MRLRTLLTGTAAGAGLLAAVNRTLSSRAKTLRPPLGRATEGYRWRGFDVSYTEAGDPDAPDLLLLHGVNAAASSAEFEAVFDALAEDYHVIAPDLPGFGLSDRPPLMYSASLYSTFVADFARDVTDRPTVVASSLSGAYAAQAAETVDFEELVLVCPTASTMPGRRTWLRSLLRAPLVGEALFNALTSRHSLRYFQRDHGFYDMSHADDEWVAYRWQLAHQPGARFAPASFVSGFLDPDVDLGATLADLDEPITIVWGRDADVLPVERGEELAEEADARFVVFDETLLLPHYEHPAEFAVLVRGELPARTEYANVQ
ncbi:alpha/beta fold hydrolase [Halomarina halobia]|uniref:Alpha/beta fold hydrolase n=1 Tax=Halomarina halobia TaxID=3033386 RepID=A0ABD6ADK0_9EURY|nr:alpha/beta hydrolase [Halomarina sp. PSR21]